MRAAPFVCVILLVSAFAFVPKRKQLAGPPSEFEKHRLPSPSKQSQSEHSALFRSTLSASIGLGEPVFRGELPVDSEEGFSVAVFSHAKDALSYTLMAPNGTVIDLEGHRSEVEYPVGEGNDALVPGTMFVFENHDTGIWLLQIYWTQQMDGDSALRVILYNADPLAVHAQLSTYDLLVGHQFGLVADVRDANDNVLDTITSADLEVVFPDGSEHDTKMHDDGLNGDRHAGDHEYTGSVTATEAGHYIAQAVFRGKNAKGVQFVRTTEHLVTVTTPQVELAGKANIAPLSGNSRIDIELDVTTHSSVAGKHYRAHAEVLGTSKSTGELVEVCWVGAMVDVEAQDSREFVTLELDLAWLEAANATEPLELANVFIQDASNEIPLSYYEQATVFNRGEPLDDLLGALNVAVDAEGSVVVTEAMRKGVRPAEYAYRPRSNSTLGASQNAVVLAHGYCSDENMFEYGPDDWTNPHFFLNKHANAGNDEYALLLADYAEQFAPYTVVGHSQGGVVATHLLNYYWTGMDSLKSDTGANDNDHRLIQSIGSPYLGNTGAGAGADFIKVFGVGCGASNDLTTDGAALWLSGITSEAAGEVYYYTTTYKDKLFEYCSLPVQLVLKKPNDGVCELSKTALPGAHNEGNTVGWCHTIKMKYEPQVLDHARNRFMNEHKA